LPDRLKPLTRYNAISVSDDRWKTDVLRLGKIISLEIPSASERRIERVRLAISASLVASLSFTTGIFCINFLQGKETLLQLWQSGIPYVAILGSVLLLSTIANLIDEERRRYIHASIVSGTMGSLAFFILLLPLKETQEPVVAFLGSVVVSSLMFAFMNISGFKAK
jgi:FtsH-binding integral membrane protein